MVNNSINKKKEKRRMTTSHLKQLNTNAYPLFIVCVLETKIPKWGVVWIRTALSASKTK
jgi:hypothetical protein